MSNLQHVIDFIAAWEAKDVERIIASLTPDAIYHNIPMSPVTGHQEIRETVESLMAMAAKIRWPIHHIAESAKGVVLTERTDTFVMGEKTVSVGVMGIFEFKNGLICAWREYFDLDQFNSQMA